MPADAPDRKAATIYACPRCGSDEWTYIDYGGCSACRSVEDRAAEESEDEMCDYVPTILPDGTVLG